MLANPTRWSVMLFASLFLFAQFALAAQACVLAFDHAPGTHDAAAAEHCISVPMEGAVCMVQCLGPDQSVSTPDHPFGAITSSTTVRPLGFVLASTHTAPGPLADSRLHVPRTRQILFCSYQI